MSPDEPEPMPRAATVRLRVLVRGQVQGVFFRASAAEEARRLGVSGRARNLADGSVELEAEGAAAAVDAFVDWCRHGPSRARVDGVETESREPQRSQRFDVL
ncbi:MAG TPA: acylphosphatase [Microthrixaceae bacterium]|nr:acylphosphatase [Microthrixaceae bacterium]